VEIPSPEEPKTPEPSKEPEAAAAAEAAKENKEQAEEHKEESKEAAEESKEAAEESKKAAEETKSSTSYNQFALKGLMDSVTLVAQRMEQVMNIVKEMKEDFSEVVEELRTTTELHQEQIGAIDAAANKIVTAAAALVKLNKELTAEQQ
jgi:hypothetical protein